MIASIMYIADFVSTSDFIRDVWRAIHGSKAEFPHKSILKKVKQKVSIRRKQPVLEYVRDEICYPVVLREKKKEKLQLDQNGDFVEDVEEELDPKQPPTVKDNKG